MQYPLLPGKRQQRQTLDAFAGYNHNPRISENQFFEMENMTSDHYPLLAPRGGRSLFAQPESPGALTAKDALCWVDGRNFVINHHKVDMGLSLGKKQLQSMGAYVIILPDKKYINTADISDRGSIEASFTTAEPVTFTLCDSEGADYTIDFSQPTEPVEPSNMALWLSAEGLQQWSAVSGMWVSVPSVCVKLTSAGIGAAFRQYDGVFLRGLEDSPQLSDLMGTAVIQAKGDDYIVIPGLLDTNRTVSEAVTVSREMPLMDFIIERENRLWGCRYGLNREGKVVNEIYASKLGDFKNWNCFQGLATDSYAASLGSDGPFTGAVTYGGYPLFWKENCVHKVFGDYPANFGIQTTPCRGVEPGSGDSLAIVGELLYYKARHGVCVYDGALPVDISEALGKEPYENAVGGGHGSKYYISMADNKGTQHLFVYDTAKHLWHREDDLQVSAFCSCRGQLYCIDGDRRILCLTEGDGEKVSWMVQTGPLGLGLPEQKYVSRLLLRLSMGLGARLRLYIQYDSLGGWESVGNVSALRLRSFAFPIRPRRCDHFRLRLEGEGDVRLYSLTKILSEGSDKP